MASLGMKFLKHNCFCLVDHYGVSAPGEATLNIWSKVVTQKMLLFLTLKNIFTIISDVLVVQPTKLVAGSLRRRTLLHLTFSALSTVTGRLHIHDLFPVKPL